MQSKNFKKSHKAEKIHQEYVFEVVDVGFVFWTRFWGFECFEPP